MMFFRDAGELNLALLKYFCVIFKKNNIMKHRMFEYIKNTPIENCDSVFDNYQSGIESMKLFDVAGDPEKNIATIKQFIAALNYFDVKCPPAPIRIKEFFL
jgi:hypothetical protein